jgi:hypothetical protein
MRPISAANMPPRSDDDLGLDLAPLGGELANAPAGRVDRRHTRVREYAAAALTRAVDQRGRQQRRVEIAVGRQVGAAADPVGAHQREEPLALLRREQLEREPERLGPGDLAHRLLLALGGAGQPDAAALNPAAVELAVERHGIHHQTGQRDASAQLSDEPRGVKGGAARELAAIDQDDIALAELGQVVRDRGAADAAADDHDAGALG